MKKLLHIIFAISTITMSKFGVAAIDIVVNKDNDIASLSGEDVKGLWIGNAKNLGDVKAELCDQSVDSPVRAEFYAKAVGKSVKEMLALWSKIVFTGRGTEPKSSANNSGVIECVKSSKGGIGYVNSGTDVAGVRKIYTIQ